MQVKAVGFHATGNVGGTVGGEEVEGEGDSLSRFFRFFQMNDRIVDHVMSMQKQAVQAHVACRDLDILVATSEMYGQRLCVSNSHCILRLHLETASDGTLYTMIVIFSIPTLDFFFIYFFYFDFLVLWFLGGFFILSQYLLPTYLTHSSFLVTMSIVKLP